MKPFLHSSPNLIFMQSLGKLLSYSDPKLLIENNNAI